MGPWHVAFVALVVVVVGELVVLAMVVADIFARAQPAPTAPAPVMPLLHAGLVFPAVSLTVKTRRRRALESDDPDTTEIIIPPGLADLPSWPTPPPPGQSTVRTGEHELRFDDLAHEETTRVTR